MYVFVFILINVVHFKTFERVALPTFDERYVGAAAVSITAFKNAFNVIYVYMYQKCIFTMRTGQNI